MRVAVVVVSVLLAGAAAFVLLLSFTFGSGGFGGSSPPSYEGLRQAGLLLAVLAPAAVAALPVRYGVVVLLLQVAGLLLSP